MNNDLLKAAIAEFIGTFILVFLGCAAVVVATINSGLGPAVPALAHGLGLVGIIFAYGHISGAHVNPAVTLGLLVGNQIKIDRAVFYWVAQFAGAVVAALVLRLVLPEGSPLGETTGSLTSTNVWGAAVLEAFLTFILVSTVYQAAAFNKAGNNAALAIGLTLAGCIAAFGALTGASLNPARTLGPALVAGSLDYVLPYFIGIFAGGAVAGVLQTSLFYSAPEVPTPPQRAGEGTSGGRGKSSRRR
jgi:MIP family channel proteins